VECVGVCVCVCVWLRKGGVALDTGLREEWSVCFKGALQLLIAEVGALEPVERRAHHALRRAPLT